MNASPGPNPPKRRRWKKRWALVPPLLLLLIGFSVLSFRVTRPDWRGLEIAARSRPAAALPKPKASEPTPAPAVVKNEEAPAPPEDSSATEAEAETETAPADVEPTEPTDVEPTAPNTLATERILALARELSHPPEPKIEADPVPLEPEARPVAPAEKPQEPVDPAKVWRDIRQAAVLKTQERVALESLKDQLLAEDIQQARQRQAKQAERRRDQLSEQNQSFRDELSSLLSTGKAEVASEIRRLASLPPPRPRPSTADGSGASSRAQTLSRSIKLRRAWVAKLRLDGQQDSVILADLLEAHRLNLLSRGGPNSDDDAVVRAAIDLLSVPPDAHPSQLQNTLLASKQPGSAYSEGRQDPPRRPPVPRRPPPRRSHCTPSVRDILSAHPYAHPDQPRRDLLPSRQPGSSYAAGPRSGQFGLSRRR